MASYATRLKAGIEIQRPIAKGVFKIKAKLGELMPPKPPNDRGQGRGGKESIAPAAIDFTPNTITAYRKLAKYADQIDAYCDACEDVPTQGEFLKSIEKPHVSHNAGVRSAASFPQTINPSSASSATRET